MQGNTSSYGSAAAPGAVSTYPTADAADVVQGVPLHFGSFPATEAQRISGGHIAAVHDAPHTAAPQMHAVDVYISPPPPPPTQRRLSAAAARRNARLRADLLRTPGVAREPSRAEQVGTVAVDVALFPLRVVRFAVTLPYHVVGAAHRVTRYALGADSK